MKALVTGAGGFVGPHLVEHLVAAGDEICALDLTTGPDLADGESWVERLQAERPDAVYHLAGWSDVGGSWQAPAETFRVNALGTLSVLEAAVEAKVGRVLIVSSADVYGRVDVTELPLTEEHPAQPRSPYGVSKQAAEALGLQHHRAHDLEVVIVRPFNHLGPGQSTRFAAPAFAAQIARAERNGGGTVVHGDLTAARDLTDVRDVVRAYRLLVERGTPGQIYNVCSGIAVTMQDMLNAMLDQASVPITTEVDPARLRPVELPILQGSPAKLEAATGWTRRLPLHQTLRDVLDDARATTTVS